MTYSYGQRTIRAECYSHVEWFEANVEAFKKDKVRRSDSDNIQPKRTKHTKCAR